MRKWALQYALHAKVLSPQSLVDEVKQDLINALENYVNKEEKI
jgi:predicted DNA-binding transcriptional regulator YafY